MVAASCLSLRLAPTRRQRLRIRAPGARRDAEDSLQIRCGQPTLLLATVRKDQLSYHHSPSSKLVLFLQRFDLCRSMRSRASRSRATPRPSACWRMAPETEESLWTSGGCRRWRQSSTPPSPRFLARSGPTGAGAAEFRIRWFTPVREVIVSVTNLPLSCFRICWLWCDWVNWNQAA